MLIQLSRVKYQLNELVNVVVISSLRIFPAVSSYLPLNESPGGYQITVWLPRLQGGESAHLSGGFLPPSLAIRSKTQ